MIVGLYARGVGYLATLHLMVGLPCSGKTTYAKQLAQQEKALRFTPDEWQIQLFDQQVYDEHSNHDLLHDRIEALMWTVAADVLALGVSAILDFGFWSRRERDDFRHRAEQLGVDFRIHYMDVPKDELIARLEKRNAAADDTTVIVEPKFIEQWCAVFEPPDADELRN